MNCVRFSSTYLIRLHLGVKMTLKNLDKNMMDLLTKRIPAQKCGKQKILARMTTDYSCPVNSRHIGKRATVLNITIPPTMRVTIITIVSQPS